eukprot:TRINITY_DN4906_c0_g2_i1.p1 TRINITY_DN4906_c0_g2~~TRINITY_DN4906_c0_g2_i1.p1  ORF type:complete len:628 (-),score=41.62 TRINITY_DN4906_c0_g2_i1:262-2145(-)
MVVSRLFCRIHEISKYFSQLRQQLFFDCFYVPSLVFLNFVNEDLRMREFISVLIFTIVAYGQIESATVDILSKHRFRQLLQEAYDFEYRVSTVGCDPGLQDCFSTPLIDECVDVEIEGAPFDCKEYQQKGLCAAIPEDKCQQSCGTCPCEDVLLPGTSNCDVIVDSNLCQDEDIRGKYCQLSCGFCGVPESSTGTDECAQGDAISCDVSALQRFKSSLSQGSNILSEWEGEDPCEWKYITCSVVDGENSRVIGVDLRFSSTSSFSNDMVGQLVPEFSKLRFIEEFQLSGQKDITGILFPEYSVLQNLTTLKIYRTGISGSVPPEYSTLIKLKVFTASFNSVSGSLPVQYSNWRLIEEFKAGENFLLSGTIPAQYSVFDYMSYFDVSRNIITGSLPQVLSSWRKCCETLGVLENQMSGTLPPHYSTMQNMRTFYFNENQFTGTLPPDYSTWTQCCEKFYVFENGLTGSLPPEYSTMTAMEEISFRGNNIEGALPYTYYTMTNLKNIFAYKNQLTGSFPPQYSAMRLMEDISIYDNSLSGTLPEEYSVMRNMDRLLAYNNGLEGSLPPQYSTMTAMDALNVNDNNMVGSLPVEYSTMEAINTFHTFGNQITTTIPSQWSTWSDDVDLSV